MENKNHENKRAILDFIIKYDGEHGKAPELWEIEKATGVRATSIMRILNKANMLIYPDESLTLREKAFVEKYNGALSARQNSKEMGISYGSYVSTLDRLRKKGFISKNEIKTQKCEESKPIYLKVFKGPFRGMRGYTTEDMRRNLIKCTLYDDASTEPVEELIYKNQIERIGV